MLKKIKPIRLGTEVFSWVELERFFIARTGYTGEKGVEFIFPDSDASELWDKLPAAGVKPIGIGARDTLGWKRV
ncbi:MAG: hypothetical protein Ct9H300mP22_0070 [Gammaproteobacteria bacterium]|nr:MAG: hypothetical protein Ct9H300mP22_0070 [Gammaproteobacteria bacterium]